ncbi:VQ motif-containing protein [Prunus dulcis]|uniref:VQ motif-containing protein n=1 Tax=Prunus dulcis TaxID=3755 RepID=A0A4Y1RF51_PRUDU|nr:VQ motif-containing protein [Prunus dulcis]
MQSSRGKKIQVDSSLPYHFLKSRRICLSLELLLFVCVFLKMDNSANRHNDHLGVNKIGKNIRKSPLHQPNFANNAARQQPQPQVYNISKNDFRNIVQQLTGSPSQEPLPRPPQNPPKPQSMRLQRIRPPPLTPINNRPVIPPPVPHPSAPPPVPYNNNFMRTQFGQPSPTPMPPFPHGDSMWANTAESPISAYMRYLQSSMLDPTPRGNQAQPQPQGPGQSQSQAPSTVFTHGPIRDIRSRASTSTLSWLFVSIISFGVFPHFKSKMEGTIVVKPLLFQFRQYSEDQQCNGKIGQELGIRFSHTLSRCHRGFLTTSLQVKPLSTGPDLVARRGIRTRALSKEHICLSQLN